MKILLLGANGQVGFELARSLAPLGELVCATRSGTLPGGAPCLSTELAKPESLAATLDAVKPDAIVNAVANVLGPKGEKTADPAEAVATLVSGLAQGVRSARLAAAE